MWYSPPLKMNGCCSTVLWELKYEIIGSQLCSSLSKVLQMIVSGSSSCLTTASCFPSSPANASNQSTFWPCFDFFFLLLQTARLTAERKRRMMLLTVCLSWIGNTVAHRSHTNVMTWQMQELSKVLPVPWKTWLDAFDAADLSETVTSSHLCLWTPQVDILNSSSLCCVLLPPIPARGADRRPGDQ